MLDVDASLRHICNREVCTVGTVSFKERQIGLKAPSCDRLSAVMSSMMGSWGPAADIVVEFRMSRLALHLPISPPKKLSRDRPKCWSVQLGSSPICLYIRDALSSTNDLFHNLKGSLGRTNLTFPGKITCNLWNYMTEAMSYATFLFNHSVHSCLPQPELMSLLTTPSKMAVGLT